MALSIIRDTDDPLHKSHDHSTLIHKYIYGYEVRWHWESIIIIFFFKRKWRILYTYIRCREMITSGALNNSVTRQLSRVPFWSYIGIIPYSSRSMFVYMSVECAYVYACVALVCTHRTCRGRNFHCELIFFSLSLPLSSYISLILSRSLCLYIVKMLMQLTMYTIHTYTCIHILYREIMHIIIY